MFEEREVTVVNTEIELSGMNEQFSDEFKEHFKNAVNYAFAKTFSESEIKDIGESVAVISNGKEKKELYEFVGGLKFKGVKNVSVFIDNNFKEDMISRLDEIIKKKEISTIILYEHNQMSQALSDYLSDLISERDVEIYFKEQIVDSEEQLQSMQFKQI